MPKEQEPTQILVVEDSPVYKQLLLKQLEDLKAGFTCRVHCVTTLAEAIALLKQQPCEAVLLDVTLPDSTGFKTLEAIRQAYEDTAIIVLTPEHDEETAVGAIRLGAQDYLIKGEFDAKLLLRVLRYSIERKRTDRAMRLIQDKLIESARFESLARLASSIAHEVLNPLGIIRLGVSALFVNTKLSDEEKQEIRKTIEESILRADAVIQRLRDFSKQQDYRFEPVDPADIVYDVQLLLNNLCNKHNIRFDVSAAPELPPIPADRAMIGQALIQVGMNAITAMGKHGVLTLSVRQRNRQGQLYVVFSMEDTGPGINPEHLPHLFDPFFTTKKNWASLGLGLSVVKGIMDRHAAEISIENREDAGVRVTLVFKV
jgi:signal transduction histidine kinase